MSRESLGTWLTGRAHRWAKGSRRSSNPHVIPYLDRMVDTTSSRLSRATHTWIPGPPRSVMLVRATAMNGTLEILVRPSSHAANSGGLCLDRLATRTCPTRLVPQSRSLLNTAATSLLRPSIPPLVRATDDSRAMPMANIRRLHLRRMASRAIRSRSLPRDHSTTPRRSSCASLYKICCTGTRLHWPVM